MSSEGGGKQLQLFSLNVIMLTIVDDPLLNYWSHRVAWDKGHCRHVVITGYRTEVPADKDHYCQVVTTGYRGHCRQWLL